MCIRDSPEPVHCRPDDLWQTGYPPGTYAYGDFPVGQEAFRHPGRIPVSYTHLAQFSTPAEWAKIYESDTRLVTDILNAQQ